MHCLQIFTVWLFPYKCAIWEQQQVEEQFQLSLFSFMASVIVARLASWLVVPSGCTIHFETILQ